MFIPSLVLSCIFDFVLKNDSSYPSGIHPLFKYFILKDNDSKRLFCNPTGKSRCNCCVDLIPERTLIECSLVCKEWNEEASIARWKRLRLSDDLRSFSKTHHQQQQQTSYFNYVRELYIINQKYTFQPFNIMLDLFQTRMNSIRYLEFSNHTMSLVMVISILESLPNLEDAEFSQADEEDRVTCLPFISDKTTPFAKLRRLRLLNIDGDGRTKLFSRLPTTLESLVCESVDTLFLDRATCLKELEVVDLKSRDIKHINFDRLEIFSAWNNQLNSITDHFNSKFLSKHGKLFDNIIVDTHIMSYMLHFFTNIKHVYFSITTINQPIINWIWKYGKQFKTVEILGSTVLPLSELLWDLGRGPGGKLQFIRLHKKSQQQRIKKEATKRIDNFFFV